MSKKEDMDNLIKIAKQRVCGEKEHPSELLTLDYSPEKSKVMMQVFCDFVNEGKPIPPLLAKHFGESFQSILDGEESKYALGLEKKKERGRPKDGYRLMMQEFKILTYLQAAHNDEEKMTFEKAVDYVADTYGFSTGTIKGCYTNRDPDCFPRWSKK